MKVLKTLAEITVFLYTGRFKKWFQWKKMLEYFSIFQDRKNVVEPTVTLRIINVIFWSHTLTHTTQWHMHVEHTWQQVNYLWQTPLNAGNAGFLGALAGGFHVAPLGLPLRSGPTCLDSCSEAQAIFMSLLLCLFYLAATLPQSTIWLGFCFLPFLPEFKEQQRIYSHIGPCVFWTKWKHAPFC